MQPTTGFRKWAPLVVLSLALLVIILDTTILNVSLKTIIGDLNTDIKSIQWVITAYSLTLAALTITGGRLGDLFGRKRMFVVGAVIFAFGAFIASVSNTVGVMIMGEAIIEGIGAALMMPATSSLIVSNYKGRDRQIAFGIWGGIAAAGAALGPVFGGWLTTYYSWRWAFRINVFVVIILVAGSMIIEEARDRIEKPELDGVGIILSALSLFLIAFGFIESSTYGWLQAKEVFHIGSVALNEVGPLSADTVSIVAPALGLGVILLYAFGKWEARREAYNKTPLVSMGLFKNSQFTLGASIMAILALGQTGMSFALPVFFQSVQNLDAFKTGLAMLPMSLTILIAAPLSAYISKYISPKRIIQAGLVFVTLGFIALIASIQVTASTASLTPGFILFGMGMGFMISQISNMTLSAVSIEQSGEASGVNGTMRTVGATLGSAVLGAILLSNLGTNLGTGVQTSPVIPVEMKATISKAVTEQSSAIEFGGGAQLGANIPPAITAELKTISQRATVDASHTTLWYGVVFILIALLLSTKLPNSKNIEVEKPLTAAH